LFLGLLLAGVGASIVPVSGGAVIFRTYPRQRRAWALGVRQMAVPLGGLVAAATVPGLDALGGPSLVLVIGAVAIALAGAAFSAVSDEVRTQQDSSVRIVRGIWHGPGLARLLVVIIAYVFLLQAVLVYTVPAMRDAGFSKLEAGIAYLAINVAAIVSRVAWGRVADREGGTRRKRTLVELGAMGSAGALAFGLALHGGVVFAVAAITGFAFAAFGWNAVVYTLAGEWTKPEFAGRAFAVAATVVFVGSAGVSTLVGALAESAGWDALWAIACAVGLTGAAAAHSLPERGAVPAAR
jgi:hypothetical protein